MAVKETQEPKLIRPSDLGESLGVDPKLIRSFLRREFPRTAEKKNTSWHLNAEMADAVVAYFTPEPEEEEGEDEE